MYVGVIRYGKGVVLRLTPVNISWYLPSFLHCRDPTYLCNELCVWVVLVIDEPI